MVTALPLMTDKLESAADESFHDRQQTICSHTTRDIKTFSAKETRHLHMFQPEITITQAHARPPAAGHLTPSAFRSNAQSAGISGQVH
jgi:hypothetical protein